MKVIPSPLVAGFSGTAAKAVAASWKGIQYVRKWVKPHNPQSTDQTTQRGYMARMSPWHRSLPAPVTTWLDDLAVGLGKSGFNLMVGEDLKHLADAEVPEIVPANAKCNALFSVADAVGGPSEVDLSWVAGVAVAAHHVHSFTCPVDPDEVAKTEPDGWTYHSAKVVLVSAGTVIELPVLNATKDYYAACLVADQAVLTNATIISGGIGVTAASAA